MFGVSAKYRSQGGFVGYLFGALLVALVNKYFLSQGETIMYVALPIGILIALYSIVATCCVDRSDNDTREVLYRQWDHLLSDESE